MRMQGQPSGCLVRNDQQTAIRPRSQCRSAKSGLTNQSLIRLMMTTVSIPGDVCCTPHPQVSVMIEVLRGSSPDAEEDEEGTAEEDDMFDKQTAWHT